MRITGIDLSHWDPNVNWSVAKAGGVAFAFFKATEGSGYVDKSFSRLWGQAGDAGVPRGAYHFFHPSVDPLAQAEHFVKTIGKLDSGDLPPVIDWEATDNVAAPNDVANGLEFLQAVKSATGKIPIVYGSVSFLTELVAGKDLAQYPLWVAEYTHIPQFPKIPPPWHNWVFWQYSDAAHIAGVGKPGSGTCDANYFNGSIEDLRAFIAASNVTVTKTKKTKE